MKASIGWHSYPMEAIFHVAISRMNNIDRSITRKSKMEIEGMIKDWSHKWW